MEAYNASSITLPFPYNYGITNVSTFTPPFHPQIQYSSSISSTLFIPTTLPYHLPPSNTTWNNMDTRIWTRLPKRILYRILAFLPLPALFRLRCVCKRWYSLVYSHSFIELYLQVSSHHHWFIFFTHKTPNTNIIIYTNNNNTIPNNLGNDPSSKAYLFDLYHIKWYTIPFSSIIPLGFSPFTCSGGLICWMSDKPGFKNLFLHNPLLGSITQLPPTRQPRLFPSVGLSVTSSSLDLILAGDDMISPYAVKNLTSETFHVDSGGFYTMWDSTASLPRLCSLESGQIIHLNGRFYCMDYNPFSVLTYDISSNLWWKIQAPLRRFLRCPCLVESKEKVILVAAVEKSKLNVPRSLRMWDLQTCGTQWSEIERMPQQLYVEFEEVEGGRGFDCVGSGEFVVIMIKGINKGLLYDFDKKVWVWMPNYCNSNYNNNNINGSGDDLLGFAYEAKLAATPVTALVHQLTQSFSN